MLYIYKILEFQYNQELFILGKVETSAALIWDISYIDTLAAIISSFVIIKWSVGLLKDTGKVLLDMDAEPHEHHHHH